MRRDLGGEVIAAIGAAALLTFAIAFGILLSVSDATEEPSATQTQQSVPDSDSNVDEELPTSTVTLTQVMSIAQESTATLDELTDLEIAATNAIARLTQNAPQQSTSQEATQEVTAELTSDVEATLSDLEIAATNAVTRLTEVAEERLAAQQAEDETIEPEETDEIIVTPTSTVTPGLTTSPTATHTETQEPSATTTVTDVPTEKTLPSETPEPSVTDSPTETNTPEDTATIAPSDTSTSTATSTATDIPTASNTPTDTATSTATDTPTASMTSTNTATATDTATVTPTQTPSNTHTPTLTNTLTPTATQTDTPTATSTPSDTATPTNTATATSSPIPRPTDNALGILPTSSLDGRENQNEETVETSDTACGSPADWPVYVVQPGNTLFSIARATGSTVSELRGTNCITDVDNITSGDELFVPQLPDGPVVTGVPSVSSVTNATISELAFLGCESPLAIITSPSTGQGVSGVITIDGTAFWGEFQYYKFEIRADNATSYNFVARFEQPVANGLIGVLDTSLFTPGLYWLRLVVVDKSGNVPQGATCAIPILIG